MNMIEAGGQPDKPKNRVDLIRGIKLRWDIVDESGQPVDCHRCIGACCKKGQVLPLNAKEAQQMQDVGTEMELIKRKRGISKPPRGREFYQFNSDCGNLGPSGECTIYDSRPQICREVPVAGETCVLSRAKEGYCDRAEYPKQK